MADEPNDKTTVVTPPAPVAQAPAPTTVQLDPKVQDALLNLMSKQGGAEPTAALLFNENKEYRDEIRRLKEQLPKAGHVVVAQEQASVLQQLEELGGLDAIKQAMADRDTYKTQYEQSQRDQLLRDVADASHFKFSVLKDRDSLTPGLDYEVKTDAKGNRTAVVKVTDGDNKITEKPLLDYAKDAWADYLPALQQSNGTGKVPPPDLDAQRRSNGAPGVDPEQAARSQGSLLRSF